MNQKEQEMMKAVSDLKWSIKDTQPTSSQVIETSLVPVVVEEALIPSVSWDLKNTEGAKANNKTQSLKPKKRFNWAKFGMVATILFSLTIYGVGGFVVINKALASASSVTGEGVGGILSGLLQGVTQQATPLQGESEGRTNFLIIGVDGSGYLADSISIVSYFYDTKEFTSIHIPRDMTVRSQYGRTKINEFFSYAEQNGERNGPKELQSLIEDELAVKIHYWAQFNFLGVKDIIDAIGGVEVEIPTTFSDCNYPADMPGIKEGQCVYFKTGKEKMDGTRALIYARSRYSYDNVAEASDFARGKRQSIVMESVLKAMTKDIKEKGGLFDPKKLSTYLDALGQNFKVSIKTNELKSFYATFYATLGGLDSIRFTKISWDTSNPIFSSSFSTPDYYMITYRDGTMFGENGISSGQLEARKEAKDPRTLGKGGSAKKASLILLGNGSNKLVTLRNQFKTLGFGPCAECFDDGYLYIKKTTAPKVTVYIADETLRNDTKDLLKNATFDYILSGALPSDKILTTNNQGTEIIVWVE